MPHVHIGEDFCWLFHLQLASGGSATGKSPAVTISNDGGAFAALTGPPAVSEIGSTGVYDVTVPGADITGTAVALKATAAASADLVDILDIDVNERIAHLALAGKIEVDYDAGTLKVYEEDGVTVLETFTLANEPGTNIITLTPAG